uniref:Uncharacterized protein n=1 Tax=Cucumis melo TaxID=3656 RepID=A0A9I9ECY7_CUCME
MKYFRDVSVHSIVKGLCSLDVGIAHHCQHLLYCINQYRPPGSESLPEGIISKSSNFEFQPLWGSSSQNCPLQVGIIECGYYVTKFMRKIVTKGSIVISDSIDT